jgi:integrase/recombinase XerD
MVVGVIICLFSLLKWGKEAGMAHVFVEDVAEGQLRSRSSFFVSPGPPTKTDLSSALEKAFGHRRGLFDRLKKLQVPDKAYLQLYLLQMHRCNFKVWTIHQSLSTLSRFVLFLNSRRVREVKRSDLEAFVEWEQDRGLQLSTVRTVLARIYAFLSFLVEEEMMPPDILVRKVKLRVPERLPRAMDPDHVRRFLSVIEDVRDRAMVLVLLRTGMRIGELLNTRVSDIRIREQTITIFEGRKNRRGRVVYLSPDALSALKRWLKRRESKGEFVFHAQNRTRMSYTTARMMFERYLKTAGLLGKGYSLHCLRHTFASELLNAGMRLEHLQELLGHDSIEVTRRYARLTNKTRREEYFRVMTVIERGQIHGSYRMDAELQTILKEKEQLAVYGQKLYDKPREVHRLARGAR